MPRTSLLGVDEERDLGSIHVREVGAERLRHPDRLAVVLLDRGGRPAGNPRRVLRDHRVVVGEAAGRQHDAAPRADGDLLPYCRAIGSDDPAVGFDDQATARGCRRARARRAPWRYRRAASST